jgi:hypothetical protein
VNGCVHGPAVSTTGESTRIHWRACTPLPPRGCATGASRTAPTEVDT